MTVNSKGHRWSQEELVALMAYWAEGLSPQEIAGRLNSTPHAIAKMVIKLRQNGIPLIRRTRGHKAGRSNQLWTQAEVEYLIRRREDRATLDEIAVGLGRTYSAVHAMICMLNREEITVPMFGKGKRRLWDPTPLRAKWTKLTADAT